MLRNLGDSILYFCILECISHPSIPTLLFVKDFVDERQTMHALLQMLLTFHNYMNQQIG